MQKNSRILLFLLFFFNLNTNGQEAYKIEVDFLLFEEAKTGLPVLVYNDSMLVKGFDFKRHYKTQFPEDLQKKHFKSYQFQIDQKNYLVDAGCGPVLQFEGTSFKRLDNSFRHQNQYYAVPFVYEKEMYLWGGYGLFTQKNILTHFSEKDKEWNLIYTENSSINKPKSEAYFYREKDKVYIYGGIITNNPKLSIKGERYDDGSMSCLDLKTMKWTKGATIALDNHSSLKGHLSKINFQIADKLYVLSSHNELVEFDFGNKVKNSYQYSDYRIISIIYHPRTEYVSYVYQTSEEKYKVTSEKFSSFKGKLVKSVPLYVPTQSTTVLKNIIYLMVLLGLGYFLFWILQRYRQQNKVLKYDAINNSFTLKNKVIKLSRIHFDILKLFAKNNNRFIALSEMNEIINFEHENFSHTTFLKRRERILKELAAELSLVLLIPKNKVFINRKNSHDKRIKEMKLNFVIRN